jgi:hypothetical protein
MAMNKCRNPRSVKTMNQVWAKLMEYAENGEWQTKEISQAFNDMLDTLLGDDFFGTEGQCDPRGDRREI